MAANLYGDPAASTLTDVGMKNYMDSYTTKAKALSTATNLLSDLGGVYSAYSTASQNKKSISQLRYEMRRNKEKMIYDWQKEDAENKLSLWTSGQTVSKGTSSAAVLASNKNIADTNIADMERAINAQIKNLKAQSKSSIASAWVKAAGTAGSLIGGVFGGPVGAVAGQAIGSTAAGIIASK